MTLCIGIYIIELSILKGTNVCNLFKYLEESSNILRHLWNISQITPNSSLVTKTNKLFLMRQSRVNSMKSYKFNMFNISYELSLVISSNLLSFGNILSLKNAKV